MTARHLCAAAILALTESSYGFVVWQVGIQPNQSITPSMGGFVNALSDYVHSSAGLVTNNGDVWSTYNTTIHATTWLALDRWGGGGNFYGLTTDPSGSAGPLPCPEWAGTYGNTLGGPGLGSADPAPAITAGDGGMVWFAGDAAGFMAPSAISPVNGVGVDSVFIGQFMLTDVNAVLTGADLVVSIDDANEFLPLNGSSSADGYAIRYEEEVVSQQKLIRAFVVQLTGGGGSVVNIDFEGASAGDRTYVGDNGALSTPGGIVWNSVPISWPGVSHLVDEFGNPTSLGVIVPEREPYRFTDSSSPNVLDDSGLGGLCYVVGIDPNQQYTVAGYVGENGGFVLVDATGQHFQGFGFAPPCYDLPGVRCGDGYAHHGDYVQFDNVVPVDLGGGVFGIGIWPDGLVTGLQVEGPGIPGTLRGRVLDSISGFPISRASVSIDEQTLGETDSSGAFFTGEINSGRHSVALDASGYYSASESVLIGAKSNTVKTFTLDPIGSRFVTRVAGRYSGPDRRAYYLYGIPLTEQFTATIDWHGHSPYEVRFSTSEGTVPGQEDGSTWSADVDMGSDFDPGAELTVQAVADGGSFVSAPYKVNLRVVPLPPTLTTDMVSARPSGGQLRYSVSSIGLLGTIGDALAPGTIPDEIPLFGDDGSGPRDFRLSVPLTGNGDIKGDGLATLILIRASVGVPSSIGGFEFNSDVQGKATWRWDDRSMSWDPGGGVEVAAHVGGELPEFHFPLLGLPAFWVAGIDVVVDGAFGLLDWNAGQPVWFATVDPMFAPYATVGVGASSDFLSVYGGLSGVVSAQFQFPGEPHLAGMQIGLSGNLGAVIVDPVREDVEVFDCTWDYPSGDTDCTLFGNAVARIADRPYLTSPQDYAVFTANQARANSVRSVSTVETPIQTNIFDQPQPTLASSGNALLLAWLLDDPSRTSFNRTRLLSTFYNPIANTWSSPSVVWELDQTADSHPALASIPGAHAGVLLAWEDVSEVLTEPDDPNDPAQVDAKEAEKLSKTEIAVSRYDFSIASWSPQQVLTDNAVLDRSPRLVTAPNGHAVLTWVSNAANNTVGSRAAPNDVMVSTYDGESWSPPTTLASGVPSIVESAMGFDGSLSVMLYVADLDDDLTTADDREIYSLWYAPDSGAASFPIRLTNDTTEDAGVQITWDRVEGRWVIVWYAGGSLVFSTDPLTLSDRSTVVTLPPGSAGAASFRLAQGPSGQIAVVWPGGTSNVSDLWYATYEPTLQVWSSPQKLTADDSVERSPSVVFDQAGDLVVAYTKVQTMYEARTVTVGGNDFELNVPTPGQSDLYALRHTVSGDLGVSEDDISLDPSDPTPGEAVLIKAQVHNLGDAPAEEVEVAFYDGNPSAGGTLIGMESLSETLAGGEAGVVSMLWSVPTSPEEHDVYVVLDPVLLQEDVNRANNTAARLDIMRPDLTIGTVVAQNAGPSDFVLTARVRNEAGLPAAVVDVEFREGAADGPLLGTVAVPHVVNPNAYVDVDWTWEDAGPFATGSQEVVAIVDPTNLITEFDERNNERSVILYNSPPPSSCIGDLDGDGDTDVFDFGIFAIHFGESVAPGTSGDYDGDGDVDVFDFGSFANDFGCTP